MTEGTWRELSKVAVLGAEYNSPERQPHPKCLKDTRVNFLEFIYGLLDKREKSQLIWLHGTAGVGKSAVAFTVAEKMQGLMMAETTKIETRLAGTFFFSRNNTERSTAGRFFVTLAHQLVINFPSVQNEVSRAIRENPAVLNSSKSLRDQMMALFRRPLRHLQSSLQNCPPPVFVVDALDECEPNAVADLISLLRKAIDDPELPVFHILLTSRSEEHIGEAMRSEEMRTPVYEIPVNISGEGVAGTISLDGEDVDNDIYTFLQHSFMKLRSRHPDFPRPTADNLARLANRAGRRFIVASTMMNFVDDGYNDPRDRLELMLDLTTKLLPGTEVYELYNRILSTCSNPNRAYQHLSIVAALADPLPISQISKLLGPGQGNDVETTLKQLRSFMDIPADSSRPVNIYHSSIRDYVSNFSNCSLHELRPTSDFSNCSFHESPHSLLAYSSFRLMIEHIPERTALMDAFLELKSQNQAMELDDPRNLQQSLAFIVEPPEPLTVLTALLLLRGARGSGLRSWLETLDGRAWLRTQCGEDYLQTQKGEDWLQTRAGRDWLQTHAGHTWLQTERGRGWLQSGPGWLWTQRRGQVAGDSGEDMPLEKWNAKTSLETFSEQRWLQTQTGQEWLQTQDGGEWLQSQTGGEWLQSRRGEEWLQAPTGQVWLQQTPSGREWLETQRGREWLHIHGEWLQTTPGREWLEKHGQEWLNTESGRQWLNADRGREWLDTESGLQWLGTKCGQEWLQTQSGRERLQTSSGREWLQTPSGMEWLQTPSAREWLQTLNGMVWLAQQNGIEWLQTPSARRWLETRSGMEWLQTMSGMEWLQTTSAWEWLQMPSARQWLKTPSGREWLKTPNGLKWLQMPSGREWLQTTSGMEWLQTTSGMEWLQTTSGREWLQTTSGREWLQTSSGMEWLQTTSAWEWLEMPSARQWLKTPSGREWLKTPNGLKWLQMPSGREWLQTTSGMEWLQTTSGMEWLQTTNGREWLQTSSGMEWLQTPSAREWLQTPSRMEWLQTPSAREWLKTPRAREWLKTPRARGWLTTPRGMVWLETHNGIEWLATQSGHDRLQTLNELQTPIRHAWLDTLHGKEWLLTQSGREWLLIQGAQEWLPTSKGQKWLWTPRGQEWLRTPGGLQTEHGQEWLRTMSGQEWLLALSGREWLQTIGGREWLRTERGREWLQTPHGQAWQMTPAASIWVTMEDFSSTLEAISKCVIIPQLPFSPALQVIQEFKSLPDFLMFPAFLALRPQDHSPSASLQDCPDIEVIHTMTAFTIFANEARDQSRLSSGVLKYACQNWVFHLLQAPGSTNHKLNHKFKLFWNNYLPSWLERQWCLKGLRSCVLMLSEGQKLAEKRLIEVTGSSQS